MRLSIYFFQCYYDLQINSKFHGVKSTIPKFRSRYLEKLSIDCRDTLGNKVSVNENGICTGFFVSTAVKNCPNLREIRFNCENFSTDGMITLFDLGLGKKATFDMALAAASNCFWAPEGTYRETLSLRQ